MNDELLKAIHAKTNAIDAVNEALKAEWQLLEELRDAAKDLPDDNPVRAKIDALCALNAALPAAVVANVTPASAGPVGLSPKDQTFVAADQTVGLALAAISEGTAKVRETTEALAAMFGAVHAAAQAIGAAKEADAQ